MNLDTFKHRQFKASQDNSHQIPLGDYYLNDSKLKAIADSIERGLRSAMAIGIGGFHPNPNDLLYGMYGIMDEDITDLMTEISQELEFEIEKRSIPIDYDTFSIRDLIDLISYDYGRAT